MNLLSRIVIALREDRRMAYAAVIVLVIIMVLGLFAIKPIAVDALQSHVSSIQQRH